MNLKKKTNNLAVTVCIVAVTFFITVCVLIYFRFDLERQKEEIETTSNFYMFKQEISDFFLAPEAIKDGVSSLINADVEFAKNTTDLILYNLVHDRHEMIKTVAVSEGNCYKWIYPEFNKYVHKNLTTDSADQGKIDYYLGFYRSPKIKRFNESDLDYTVIYIPIWDNGEYFGRLEIYFEPVNGSYIDSFLDTDSNIYIEVTDNQETFSFGEDNTTLNPLKFTWEQSTGVWNFYVVPEGGWRNNLLPFIISIVLLLTTTIIIFRIIYVVFSKYNQMVYDKEQYVNLSTKDSLTGIFNRVYINQVAKQEFAKADRSGSDISLIYFDIDKFKDINDTFGHDIGDNVLVNFTKIVSSNIRSSDVFARWGGDEFLILLVDTDLSQATIVANKILAAVRDGDYGLDIKLTASFGVSIRARNEYYSSLFRRTDKALYTAKENGRNQVNVSTYKTDEIDIKIPWLDSWRCGHHTIDEQHKMLTVYANNLMSTYLQVNELTPQVKELTRQLIKSIKEHSDYEIAVLTKQGYPDVQNHKDLHEQILREVYSLHDNLEKDTLEIRQFHHFLLNRVIINHLLKEDVKFFDFIKNDTEI